MPSTPTSALHDPIPWSQLRPEIVNLFKLYLWRKNQEFRAWIDRHLNPIGFVGIGALIVEILLEFAGATRELGKVGAGISVVVLFVLIVLFAFKRAEHWEQKRQQIFLRSAHLAVTALEGLALEKDNPQGGQEHLETCVNEVLQIILDTFAWRGSLNANVMLPEGDNLAIRFAKVQEGVEYDVKFRPAIGEGGAGLCLQEQTIIYFPNIAWRHGVQIRLPDKTRNTVELIVRRHLYKTLESNFERHYRSILCVPIAAYHNCYGALNLDSRYANPFTESDYQAVAFFGAIIGLAFYRYQTVYG